MLSKKFVDDHELRVSFFEELLGITVGDDAWLKLITRNPEALYKEASYFLFNNFDILKDGLTLSTEGTSKLIQVIVESKRFSVLKKIDSL